MSRLSELDQSLLMVVTRYVGSEIKGDCNIIIYSSSNFAFCIPFRKQNADLIADELEFMYTPWPDRSDHYALRRQLVDLVGDYVFVAPGLETADIHSQSAPVYVYEFAHRSKVSALSEWKGVAHGKNAVYDFGIPLLPGIPLNFDATDRNVSLFIMAMCAEFAKSGKFTVSGVTWEKFNTSNRAYLRVDANPKMAVSFYPRRMSFWNVYYPKLAQIKFGTKKGVVSGACTGVTMGTFIQIVLFIFMML